MRGSWRDKVRKIRVGDCASQKTLLRVFQCVNVKERKEKPRR